MYFNRILLKYLHVGSNASFEFSSSTTLPCHPSSSFYNHYHHTSTLNLNLPLHATGKRGLGQRIPGDAVLEDLCIHVSALCTVHTCRPICRPDIGELLDKDVLC